MAYIKKAVHRCEWPYCRVRNALWEVYNHRNQLVGRYCKAHAEMQRVRENDIERALGVAGEGR